MKYEGLKKFFILIGIVVFLILGSIIGIIKENKYNILKRKLNKIKYKNEKLITILNTKKSILEDKLLSSNIEKKAKEIGLVYPDKEYKIVFITPGIRPKNKDNNSFFNFAKIKEKFISQTFANTFK